MAKDSEWQQVSLDQLQVTTGKREVQQTASGFLSLNTAKTRAQLKAGLQRHVLLQFRYRGQTPDPEPNRSGKIVEQIGVKLRTLNTCNVLYVMWRITQPEGIAVKLKRNPGLSQHKDCGANGYIPIAPSSQMPLAVTASDQRTHRTYCWRTSTAWCRSLFRLTVNLSGPEKSLNVCWRVLMVRLVFVPTTGASSSKCLFRRKHERFWRLVAVVRHCVFMKRQKCD